MHNSKLKKITVALCIALMPMAVFSAGLGKLNVSSGLGEPLRADIELLSVTPEELNSIIAAIASEEAYANQGIERPASHATIKVEVGKNSSGTPILKLKSSQPISEPFLDMLIQVDWASGRLLREYTVLLDPPGYTGEAEANAQYNSVISNQTTQMPVVGSSSAAVNNQATGTSVENKKSNRRNKARQTRDTEASPDTAEPAGEGYVTQRGDSLAKIAQELKPEGISLDQMLVGLYQANPDAFDGKNMNRLKVGKIIRPPTEQELAALSTQKATKEVKVQSANWNAYRNKLAGIVAESAPAESEASTQSADGKIKSTAEDKSMPAATGPKDVVKLSAGESALTKQQTDDVKGLQAKITALQEESTAREKSVKEAQDKTAALEKQIADMQQLMALKNGAMSDLQKQAEIQALADKNKSAVTQPDSPAAAQEAKPVEAVPVEPVKSAELVKPVEPSPVANPATPEAKVKPATVVAAEPVAEPSFFDGIDLPLIGGGAGLLALLGGGWMFLRNKRKRNLADFEQGIMTSGGLKANTVFGNTSGSSVDTGDTSFLTDFSQSANGGMIDTNDVDPIAEAEVYMAYGRDAQAEEILKDAISKEPKRYELHLKLLEMYAAAKNVSAFETIAGELYTTLGAEDSTWAKVAEIGHKLEPSNPLYQANAAHANSAAKLDANDFSDSPIATETDLDFSFDNESLVQDFASKSKDAFDLDLDGSSLDTPNLDTVSSETNSQTVKAELNSDILNTDALEFNTVSSNDMSGLDELEQTSAVLNETVAEVVENSATAENDGGLDFDFGDLTASADEEADKNLTNFSHTMPGLDMSGFGASTPEPVADVADISVDKAAFIDTATIPHFESEISDTFELPVLEESNDLDTGMIVDDSRFEETDFNFNLSTVSPEASSYVEEDVSAVNTYDLSSINLDITDANTNDEALSFAADEPIEIETKLDLVAAYIEMDDVEGAKELLDEVLKEGGATQRKRAEALLSTLG